MKERARFREKKTKRSMKEMNNEEEDEGTHTEAKVQKDNCEEEGRGKKPTLHILPPSLFPSHDPVAESRQERDK